jgi:hypothetical protein
MEFGTSAEEAIKSIHCMSDSSQQTGAPTNVHPQFMCAAHLMQHKFLGLNFAIKFRATLSMETTATFSLSFGSFQR